MEIDYIEKPTTARRPTPGRRAVALACPRWEKWLCGVVYLMGFFGFHVFLNLAVVAGVPTRFGTVPVRGLALGVSLAALVIWVVQGRPMYRGKAWWFLLGFWGLYGLRILYEWGNPSLIKSGKDYLIFGYGVCLLPMLGFMLRFREDAVRWAFRVLLASGFIACLSCGWIYRGFFGGFYGRLKKGQMIGDYVSASPLTISYMGSSFIVLGIYLLFDRAKSKSPGRRLALALVVIAAGTVPLLLGASRGSLVAVVFATFCMVAVRLNRSRDWLSIGLGLTVFSGFLVWLYVNASSLGSTLVSRFLNIGSDVALQTGRSGRLVIYQAAWSEFWESPHIGSGLTIHAIGYHPHNMILESFLATGLLGGGLFLAFLCVCFWRSLQLLKARSEFGWIAVLFLHYFIYGQLSTSITTNSFFWVSAGGVLACAVRSRRSRPGALGGARRR